MPSYDWKTADIAGLNLALEEARKSIAEGGIPIGSCIIIPDESDSNGYKIIGSGHNERLQRSSPTLHGEISALENAGRLKANLYRKATIYTTLSMCTGAVLLYNIPRVVIGENNTFLGEESLLRERGVEVIVLNNHDCEELMKSFISTHPEEWNEDIGEMD